MKKLIFSIIATITIFSPVASALSEADLDKLDIINAPYYKPINCVTDYRSSGITGNNRSYDGQQVFSDAEMALIAQNRPFYEAAAAKYGLPWQALAVIHSQETGLRRYNPGNGQGVYQLHSYTAGGANSNRFAPSASISDAEFARQTDIAASTLARSYGGGLNLSTPTGIKTMFFRYNGTASAYIAQARGLGYSEAEANSGEGSPYVMNRADAARDPSSARAGTWGQIKTDGGSMSYPANNHFGAYVKFQALGGSEEVNSSIFKLCSGTSDGSSVGGGGSVTEGGLTIEQAKIFMMNYGANIGNDSANAVGALWNFCGGGGSNCVTFSAFFLNKFTGTRYAGGNGYQVVGNLSGVRTGTTPQVWAVWSVGNSSCPSCTNHTGIVLGIHNGQYIIGHAACSRGHRGLRGKGDGTLSGGGSGFITIEGPDPSTWYGANGMPVTFAYPNSVNVSAIEGYIN